MKCGNIVIPKEGTSCLQRGNRIYQFAIVIHDDPFELTSQECDMRWINLDPEDFEVIGNVSDEVIINCLMVY